MDSEIVVTCNMMTTYMAVDSHKKIEKFFTELDKKLKEIDKRGLQKGGKKGHFLTPIDKEYF